jgi:hypothetical protein
MSCTVTWRCVGPIVRERGSRGSSDVGGINMQERPAERAQQRECAAGQEQAPCMHVYGVQQAGRRGAFSVQRVACHPLPTVPVGSRSGRTNIVAGAREVALPRGLPTWRSRSAPFGAAAALWR